MKKLISILLITLMITPVLMGAANSSGPSQVGLKKSLIFSDFWMDVNRMNGAFRNNGIWMFDVIANDWGLEWPKGSGLSPVFAGGQYICAKVDGEIRVAGVQHSATEFQPGAILEDGTADNPRDGKYRWYVIGTGGTGDYANWPVDQGAPLDEDGNPLLLGDKTAFSVWNDLGDHAEYGTNKLGAEVRQTIFAFNRADAMGDMIFIKWQVVNKSGVKWDSTYLAIWVDPDVGYALDDFVGCDTTLGLGICYNADNDDQQYGSAPPAMGVDFFQGPILDEEGSVVTLPNGTVLQDKTMLSMTNFIYYNNDRGPQGNPFTGGEVWGYMTGKWKDGTSITEDGKNGIDQTFPPTTFMFSGDPESNEGWLDSNADDRRFLMNTGPFNMPAWEDTDGDGMAEFGEPGVQEIVAGVIVARGTDNLNSVTRLKEVDELAQLAYDLDFKLATPPLAPVVEVQELPNEAVLTWGVESEFNQGETPTIDGSPNVADSYTRYNAPDPIVAADYGKVTKVFTLRDVVTDTGTVTLIDSVVSEVDDSSYNFYGYTVYQYSDASGKDPVIVGSWNNGGLADAAHYEFPHFINLTVNKHKDVGTVGDKLYNGKEYYFGVVAHGYLEYGSPQILDSPPTIVTVVPEYMAGEHVQASYNDTIAVTHSLTDASYLKADATVIPKVVNATEVTGHNYKVYFNQQHYYYDEDGNWKKTAYEDSIGKGAAKPMDVSGSTVTGVSYVASPTTRDLLFTLMVTTTDYSCADGLLLTFPSEVEINSAVDDHGNLGVIDATNNTVMFGSSDTTGFGPYCSMSLFTVNVNTPTLPLAVPYVVYDDAWGYKYLADYGLPPGTIVDATGTCTISEQTNYFETIKHWNLMDVTTGQDVLEDREEMFTQGSFGYTAPMVDGLQVIVAGSYAAPYDFLGVPLSSADETVSDKPKYGGYDATSYDIDSYGYNHWADAPFDYSARAVHSFTNSSGDHVGSTDLTELVNDYELRFTGEYGDSTIIIDGMDTTIVYPIKEGTGSIATLYGARQMDIEDHPMNPSPGTDAPFTVRIPFEVWNVTTNEQINIMIYDRIQMTADSNTVKIYAFNPNDRMYCYILNTPYSEEVQDIDSEDMNHLTWNLVFWTTNWFKGNVLKINYANPINLGIDEFTFSTANYKTNISAATKEADLDKINVVPNPYYGHHSGEMDPFDRWVQFTYLPAKCTVRIFDLAGSLVRILEKDDASTSLLQWNLENEYELPVASGIYVYHVDAPGIGEKIGKIAVFTPNERLDTY